MKTAKLIVMARALRNEIQQTPEADLTEEQNAATSDLEWELTKFIEMVESKCAVPASPAPARVEERKVA